jgi:hypothetical protein
VFVIKRYKKTIPTIDPTILINIVRMGRIMNTMEAVDEPEAILPQSYSHARWKKVTDIIEQMI